MMPDKPRFLISRLLLLCIITFCYTLLPLPSTHAATLQVGGAPSGVAIDQATNRAVVANEKENTVSIVDLTGRAVISTIPVGENPAGVAIAPQAGKAVITNRKSDSISIIDLNTQTLIATVPVGEDPYGVSINPITNIAAITNSKSDTVTTVDLINYTVTQTIPVGKEPQGIAINPAANQAVIVNHKADNISLVDLESYAVIATIPVGRDPAGVGIDSVANRAVITNKKDNTITIIDLNNNTAITTISVGEDPASVAVNTVTRRALIANRKGDSVTLIDLDTNTVLGDIQVGKNPEGVTVNPDNNTLVVTNKKDNSISIIELDNAIYTTTTPAGKDPKGVAINPDTNMAIIANEKSNDITVLDLNTYQIITTIPVGIKPVGVAIDRGTNTALVTNQKDDTVSVIDLNTNTLVNTIEVGKSPVGVAVDPARNTALVTNHKGNTLSIIDPGSGAVTATIQVGRSLYGIAVNPGNNTAVLTNEKEDTVTVIDLITNTIINTIGVGKNPAGIAINPDTAQALVANEKDDTITIIDLNANTITATIPAGKDPWHVAVNPATGMALITNHKDDTVTLFDLATLTVTETISVGKGPYGVAINPNTNIALVTNEKDDTLTTIYLPGYLPDTIPPDIQITSPPDGDVPNTPTLTVSGTVTDSYGQVTTVTVNNTAATFGNDTFQAEIHLTEGQNTITARAVDNSGNTGEDTITVTLDTIPPQINITGVADGQITNQDITPVITITDLNPGTQAITLNNQPYTSGTPITTEGAYTLWVMATDLAGNTSGTGINFTIDKTPPVLSIISPSDGSITNLSPITVTGSIDDDTTTVTVNGINAAVAGNTFQTDIPLTEGLNTITATAADPAGNTSAAAITVTLNQPPQANAGQDQYIYEGVLVMLDGSLSTDPDGKPLTYLWTQISGTTVTLSDPSSVSTTFTAPSVIASEDILIFQLIVNDGIEDSVPDTVSITINSILAPTITSFSPQNGNIGTTVTITGTNFDAGAPEDNQVSFNTTPSLILNITETTITTTVPENATTGPISVTTTYGTASSTNNFIVDTEIPEPIQPTAYIKGMILDASNDSPIAGVNVSVKDLSVTILTDANGEFTYNLPEGGEYILYFEKSGYVIARETVYIESSRTTGLDSVYLTPYDTKFTLIVAADGGTATDSTGTVEMIFPPGALPADTEVSATRFFDTKGYPVPIPRGQVFIDAIQLEPAHTDFNGEVTVRLTNRFGFAPGTKLPFAFGSHEPDDPFPEATYYDPQMAEVTADGQYIEMKITHFSCPSFILPPGPPTGSGSPINSSTPFEQPEWHQLEQGKNIGAAVNRSDGNLVIDYTTIPYRSLGIWKDITLIYNSSTAQPGTTVAVEVNNTALDAAPIGTGVKISVEGVTKDIKYESADAQARMAYFTGGEGSQLSSLPSGTYYPQIALTNDYQANFFTADIFSGPPVSDTGLQTPDPVSLTNPVKGAININNQQQSPFGWGWGMKGIQRLIKNPDGSVLIIDQGGDALQYRPGHLPGEPAVTSVASGLNYPVGITYDPQGNIYITDTGANTIYKIAPDTPAVPLANLTRPTGIAYSPDGYLYVASKNNWRIFKVYLDGTTEPFVNLPVYAPNIVEDLVVDSQGNLYVYDTGGPVGGGPNAHALYKITPQGNITTLIQGENKLLVSSMAISPDDTLYLAFNNVGFLPCSASFIARFTPGAGLTTFAANLNSPAGMAFDRNGTLYVVDRNCATQNYHVYRIDRSGYKSEYIEDNLGTDLALPLARLNHGLAIGPEGELAIASTTLQEVYVEKGFDTLAPPPGEFSLLTPNPDNTYTLAAKDGTVTEFDARGLMISRTDRNNNTSTYTYSPEERLISITDPVGEITSFSYDAGGRLEYILDPAGRITRFEHDISGNLTGIVNPDNTIITYTYDTGHLLLTKTAPNVGIYTYTYNSLGRIEKITDPEGGVTQLSPGQMQGLINDIPQGEGTSGAPASIISPESIIDMLINAEGDLNQNRTDADGALLEIIDALGQITTYERNRHHHPTLITNPNGSTTTMDYDLWGNLLTSIEENITATTTYTYEPNYNQVTNITDPQGNTTTMTYDTNGNLITTTDALGNITQNTYNQRGQVTSTTNALGQTTTMTYDEKGNLLTTTDPLGNITTNTYDAAGNLISTTDAEGKTTTYEYDTMNRLVKTTDPHNNTTTYTYSSGSEDTKADLISITDANSNATAMTYDLLSRLIQITNPGGYTKTYTYDDNNNMTSSTDARGQTTLYEYDSLNRLSRKMLPDDDVRYLYDSVNNLLEVRDFDSRVAMGYDTQNRLIQSEAEFLNNNTKIFTIDAIIAGGETSYDDRNIIVDGAELTIEGPHTFLNLTIINGGRVTHNASTTTTTSSLNITITGTLTIDAASGIDVTGKGYLGGYSGDNNTSYGRTIGNTTAGGSGRASGGSYGGLGDPYGGTDDVNAVYGSLYEPDELGSGGGGDGYYGYGPAGNGGGLVRITAGEIVLDGNIRADGGDGADVRYTGGGSGGGIYIQTGALSGTGIITADGGKDSPSTNFTKGGGGGRIVIYYDDISGFDTARITAYGGIGFNAAGGAAGTIYLKSSIRAYGDLIIDNNNLYTNTYYTYTLLRSIGSGTITDLTTSVLTDDNATYPLPDPAAGAVGLTGLEVDPDINDGDYQTFTVIDNTATTLSIDPVDGAMTSVATIGDTYSGVHIFNNLIIRGKAYVSTDDVIIIKGAFSRSADATLSAPDIIDQGTSAPTVNITSPADGSEYPEGSTRYITVGATDDLRVASVDFLIDGSVVNTDDTYPYQYPYTIPVGITEFTIGATAVDFAGNQGTAADVNIDVLFNPPPVVTITSPVDGTSLVEGYTINITAGANDDTLVDHVEFLINGTTLFTDYNPPYEMAYTIPAGVTNINIKAIATDDLGKASTYEVNVNVVIDPPPPIITITSPLDGSSFVEGSTINIDADVSSPIVIDRVKFLINGTGIGTDYTAPYVAVYTIPAGSPDLVIRTEATDIASQIGADEITVLVTTDIQTTVTGQVVDTSGLPVQGATVNTRGGGSGTTDFNGEFSISGVPTTEDITAMATGLVNGDTVSGRSNPIPPVAGGITDVGIITLTGRSWVAAYNGPASGGDSGKAIAIDANGNIYVTGESYDSSTGYDYATVKYDLNGNELWVARYNGPGNDYDYATAIAIDTAGNVYVTGESYGSSTGYDYATVKYDTYGNVLWVARYIGPVIIEPSNSYDSAAAIVVDTDDNVYVTGISYSYVSAYDYATVKYDTNGNELWVARYNGPGNDYDYANAIAIDANDNVYVTGGSYDISAADDYATIKYDPNGNELWVARYNGPGNDYDYANAIAIDATGNVYVTGGSYDISTADDYATVKYDPNGNELWVKRHNGPGNSFDYANAIAIDVDNNIFVAGDSYDSATGYDYATIKYDTNGNELWVARYNGPGNQDDLANAIAVDADGAAYVTGMCSMGTDDDYCTVRLPLAGSGTIIIAALDTDRIHQDEGDKPVRFAKQVKQDTEEDTIRLASLSPVIPSPIPGEKLTLPSPLVGEGQGEGDSQIKQLTDSTTETTGADPQYTYDLNNNRITMTDPTGTTTYTYDALNRLTSITNPDGEVTTFSYDAVGRHTGLTYANGAQASYSYDDAGRLLSLVNQIGATTVSTFSYTYNQVGNRTQMVDNDGTHNYLYDQLYRLIDATHPQPQNPAENFDYDPVGNRTTSQISSSYSYDNMNRLLEDDQYTYSYDANGNLTGKVDKVIGDATTYEYDAENRLTKVITPTDTVDYQYDGLGRRIARTVNGVMTKYIYDEKDVLLELDETGQIKARYTRTLEIDELISVDMDTDANGTLETTYYYHRDGLGSVTAMTDSSGAVVQNYVYDAFGNIKDQTGSIGNRYTYTSREWDEDADLYYYRARFYNAGVGRFVSEDPSHYLHPKEDNTPYMLPDLITIPQELNNYVYVKDNPLNLVDPLGLCVECIERPCKVLCLCQLLICYCTRITPCGSRSLGFFVLVNRGCNFFCLYDCNNWPPLG